MTNDQGEDDKGSDFFSAPSDEFVEDDSQIAPDESTEESVNEAEEPTN